jgi:hypothetical protein
MAAEHPATVLARSWIELRTKRESLLQALEEDANFGGHPVAGRPHFSGFRATVNRIAADILQDGILGEHWHVIQDEATEEPSNSKALCSLTDFRHVDINAVDLNSTKLVPSTRFREGNGHLKGSRWFMARISSRSKGQARPRKVLRSVESALNEPFVHDHPVG